jgi:hypothetical protein
MLGMLMELCLRRVLLQYPTLGWQDSNRNTQLDIDWQTFTDA